MGIAMFSSGSDPTPPNPNPALFTILSGFDYQECCVLVVRYPGCTTFEGKKVLVLLGKVSDYVGIKNLDPHFTTDGYLVARFVPTESGIQCAKDFAQRVRVRKSLPTEMGKAFWDVREGPK